MAECVLRTKACVSMGYAVDEAFGISLELCIALTAISTYLTRT